jgi:ELWxxDGT repeat protein
MLEISPGVYHGVPTYMTPFQQRLYFFGSASDTSGTELMSADSAGTVQLVHDFNPAGSGVPGPVFHLIPEKMAVAGNQLYFFAHKDSMGFELFRYDGVNPPVFLHEVDSSPFSGLYGGLLSMTAFNNQVFFSAYDGLGPGTAGLFRYDPANGSLNTVRVRPGTVGAANMVPFRGRLLMSAFSPATGTELYSYDPATDSCVPAADIFPGGSSSGPIGLTVLGDTLYFNAADSLYGRELYGFDGQSATRKTDLMPGPADGFTINGRDLAAYKGALYGNAYINNELRLLRYQPATGTSTAAGSLVANNGYPMTSFCVYDDKLFFSASSVATGMELWSWDGTQEKLEADINPGSLISNPQELTVAGGYLYFRAGTLTNGTELYRYDKNALRISQVTFDGSLTLAPNPVTGTCRFTLTLRRPEALRLSLTDMAGRVVRTSAGMSYTAGQHQIDLPMESLPAGTYTYRLEGTNGSLRQAGKVVRQ